MTQNTVKSKFSLNGQNFFLTFPQNDTDAQLAMDRLKQSIGDDLVCAIIAQEKHQDGHNHLHIYFKTNKRIQTTKNTYFNYIADKQGNYQTCRKPIDVINYISKTGNYITYNLDVKKYNYEKKTKTTVQSKGIFKQITDLITDKTNYEDILNKYPEICLQHGKKIKEYIQDIKLASRPKFRNWQMDVEYHYGDTGTGKSKYAFEGYNPETHYVLRKANGENNVWWDGYTGQETVIIDDFSPKCYRLSYMLNLLDRYAMTVDYKGGSTQMLAKRVIITSNYAPNDLYTTEVCKEHKKALLRRFTLIKEYIKETPLISQNLLIDNTNIEDVEESISGIINQVEDDINIINTEDIQAYQHTNIILDTPLPPLPPVVKKRHTQYDAYCSKCIIAFQNYKDFTIHMKYMHHIDDI